MFAMGIGPWRSRFFSIFNFAVVFDLKSISGTAQVTQNQQGMFSQIGNTRQLGPWFFCLYNPHFLLTHRIILRY
jgi:hypothetical protein